MDPERFLDVDLPRTPEPAHLDANGLVSDTRHMAVPLPTDTSMGQATLHPPRQVIRRTDLTQFGSSSVT